MENTFGDQHEQGHQRPRTHSPSGRARARNAPENASMREVMRSRSSSLAPPSNPKPAADPSGPIPPRKALLRQGRWQRNGTARDAVSASMRIDD